MTRMRRDRAGRRRRARGQAAVEMIIVAGLVILALAWMVTKMPEAITNHYVGNVQVLASPF